MRRKIRPSPHLQMQDGLLLWCLTQYREEMVGTWVGSATQEVSLSQKVTYQLHSRHQTGSKSYGLSASSGKCSQRCSQVWGQAEQGPVGKVSSCWTHPTHPRFERETLLHMGEMILVLFRLYVQCLLRLYVKHWVWIREVSVCFSNFSSLGQQWMFKSQSMQTSFIQYGCFWYVRSPTLK